MNRAEVLNLHKEYQPHLALPDPRTETLVSESEILRQLPMLGAAFGKVLPTLRNPLFIWIANGAQQFADDLISNVPQVAGVPDFDVAVIQYRSRVGIDQTSQNGILLDETIYPFPDVRNRDVIGIDDVLDTGETALAFVEQVLEFGGRVTDLSFAAVKPEVDRFKGNVRLFSLPNEIRVWPLTTVPALWLYKYGMDNGNDTTEDADRAGREIRVNWEFEKEKYPEACAYYLKQALLRDPEAAKRLG